MTRAAGKSAATAPWPVEGVLRVHYEPAALPRPGDEPGVSRFDDPRPRTIDRFLMRYGATSLRGCLLELLAGFRDNAEAESRIEVVHTDDPDLVEPPALPDWQHISDYLRQRRVATIHGVGLAVVSMNDPSVQRDLDREPGVRAVLDTDSARSALLEHGGSRVHLDNAAVRLSSETGRYITQACALALYDRDARPDAIHYRSRHDDNEDCWAIYHYATVEIGSGILLSPKIREHKAALRDVAELWDLPVPPAWQG